MSHYRARRDKIQNLQSRSLDHLGKPKTFQLMAEDAYNNSNYWKSEIVVFVINLSLHKTYFGWQLHTYKNIWVGFCFLPFDTSSKMWRNTCLAI